ncbi:MAG: DUF354 domain-containing protein [Bacteroidota bacterium]
MRILIDVGHPSDVHLFRLFYEEMLKRNHQILFTARDKEVTIGLLDAFKLNYISYGKPFKSRIGKLLGILKFDLHLYRLARRFKPDLFFSHGSFYSSHVAFLMRKPFITFEDTGNLEQILLYKFFADVILTPDTFVRNLGKKHLKFKGTKELAYLHPNNFVPDMSVLDEIGIKPGERIVLLRFVGWNASHDFGHNGITYANKLRIIKEASKQARVFISSESKLPEDIAHLQIKIAPEKILSVMYYADLLYGESATMASECAIMGTPAIFVNNANISYTKEQEKKYDLIYNFTESAEDQEKSIEKALALLAMPDLKNAWRTKSLKLIHEKIDLTAFMIWFIEQYPDSSAILHKNPLFQDKFIMK